MAEREWFHGVRIDDAYGHTGERVADASALHADLAEAESTIITRVNGDNGSTFGATVTFQWTNLVLLFEGDGKSIGEFLGAHDHILQGTELLGGATTHVGL